MRATAPTLLALLLAAAAAVASPDDPATEVIVTVGSRFDPAVVEIRRGVRLTFHSLADRPGGIVVVAADGSFESWALGMHGQWSHRFVDAGSFEYFVKHQPETRGRAIVR